MKSKTSYSRLAAFRKDITRFAPLWGLYFIGGVLVMLSVTDSAQPHYVARILNEMIGPFAWINLVYACLCAQLLFGDLFNSRLCNALHAMPLRREHWFFSHIAAGICFSLVPNTLGILTIVPWLGQFWYTAFLWLLGMELHFMFFFGLAVFSVMLTGNRFAMVAVYGIVNFFSILAQWFVTTVYEPLLYGVKINTEPFVLFCPLQQVSFSLDYFAIESRLQMFGENDGKIYYFAGLGDGWGYLVILAVLGVVLGALALVLYRRRALESAGDFMAVRQSKPVFLLVYTLCMGAVFALLGELITSGYAAFLLVGIAVGYFTGQMLLQRTVKVFRLRTVIGVGILAVVMVTSLFLTKLDLLGVSSWQPNIHQIQNVKFSTDRSGYYSFYALTLEDPETIQEVLDIHRLIIEEGEPSEYVETITVSLQYELVDGRNITREYQAPLKSKFFEPLKEFLSRPEYTLGYKDWESFVGQVENIYANGYRESKEIEDATQRQALLEALKADCEDGNLVQLWEFHDEDSRFAKAWVTLDIRDSGTRDIQVFLDSENTLQWLKEYAPQLMESQ